MADIVFISPHLDDAVYSCGGTIAKLADDGLDVTIITVFAAEPSADTLSPFARSLHQRWDPEDSALTSVVQTRQLEDAAAAIKLQADSIHLEYLDCIYRTTDGVAMYDSDEAIFGAIDPGDSDLPVRIVESITALNVIDNHTVIYGPLSLGNHVDHKICHDATKLFQTSQYFYEDYPYSETELFEASQDWKPIYEVVSEDQNSLKIAAMQEYKSQLSTFWTDEKELFERVTNRWMSMGGNERFWCRVGYDNTAE